MALIVGDSAPLRHLDRGRSVAQLHCCGVQQPWRTGAVAAARLTEHGSRVQGGQLARAASASPHTLFVLVWQPLSQRYALLA
mgnify:CR=1 FL=1